jgi:2-polyprenyl-3-methyl-5-hydroxy-6-metoxy-1,4-benzoquinol methylase
MLDHAYFIERTVCPCCTGSDCHTIYECAFDADPIRQYLRDYYEWQGGVEFEYLQGARFVLQQCRTCSLIFQAQIGNDVLMHKLYEEWIDPAYARALDDRCGDLGFYVGHLEGVLAVLSEIGKLPSETRVFDFGMGWGRWCRLVQGLGCQVYGTELSEERIAFARSHGIKALSWDEIPGNEFDFIKAEQVFEHLPQPLTTLKHLARGLAQGGLLSISVPNAVPNGVRVRELLKNPDWKAPKRSPRSLNAVTPLEHINCFDHKALTVLGRKAGMVPVKLEWRTQIEVNSIRERWSNLVRTVRAPLGRLKRAIRSTLFETEGHELCRYFRKA